MVEKTRFHAIAYAALGSGLSGGDNILIELCKRWKQKVDIHIYSGAEMQKAFVRKNLLGGVIHHVCPAYLHYCRYLERMVWALRTALSLRLSSTDYIYTASDFPHDALVGAILKNRFSSIGWVASCYLVAPLPFSPQSPYKVFSRIRGIGYWLIQQPMLWLIRKYADVVCVTSEPERKYFPDKKVCVVRGGVNIPNETPRLRKTHDIVFMGRLHYQKGIRELIAIFRLVRQWFPYATLLIAGDGPQKKLLNHIKGGLFNQVTFLDDEEKDIAFRLCKIIVHPATFDSGGMSCAEGMAYGLPAVGFDLETYKTYYPKGMLKAKDNTEFATHIINLLTDKELYDKVSKDAKDLINEQWNWDRRAEEIWEEIK